MSTVGVAVSGHPCFFVAEKQAREKEGDHGGTPVRYSCRGGRLWPPLFFPSVENRREKKRAPTEGRPYDIHVGVAVSGHPFLFIAKSETKRGRHGGTPRTRYFASTVKALRPTVTWSPGLTFTAAAAAFERVAMIGFEVAALSGVSVVR